MLRNGDDYVHYPLILPSTSVRAFLMEENTLRFCLSPLVTVVYIYQPHLCSIVPLSLYLLSSFVLCVSINALCSLGRGLLCHPIRTSTHSSFVSIFVVLLSVWMTLILQILLVALALHKPLDFARFTIGYGPRAQRCSELTSNSSLKPVVLSLWICESQCFCNVQNETCFDRSTEWNQLSDMETAVPNER